MSAEKILETYRSLMGECKEGIKGYTKTVEGNMREYAPALELIIQELDYNDDNAVYVTFATLRVLEQLRREATQAVEERDSLIEEKEKEILELKERLSRGHRIKAGEKVAMHKTATPEACKKLRDDGYSIEGIAHKLDCSIMTVRRKLGLGKKGEN